ncbi:MAG: hypothetical protein M5U12_30565 [Verrucomicrobia bacterium]|nr:hypothetical protein [Verrucomicrobiota bacterium]
MYKTTDTVAGVANTALLGIEQYSVRAKMQIPGSKVITASHRASSGTTRTITLAEPHGMITGAYFTYGSFGHADYNPLTNHTLGIVTGVPAPNKLTYTSSATLTEAETSDTTGQILVLGWKRLRLGMRFAIPRTSTSNWDAGTFALGLGVSQGSYPIGSPQCARWWGFANAGQSTLNYFTSSGTYTVSVGNGNKLGRKVGSGWGGEANFVTSDYISLRGQAPSMVFIDAIKGTGNAWSFSWKCPVFSSISQVTAERFLAILKSPIAFLSSSDQSLEGLTLSGYIQQLSTTAFIPAVPENGADLYLEPFIRASGQPMEIMDIGYAVLM